MNLSIPFFELGKDGLLEVEDRPDVKWSGCDRTIQGADHARILTNYELVLCVEAQGVEALAK